jgi:hypothetical protein
VSNWAEDIELFYCHTMKMGQMMACLLAEIKAEMESAKKEWWQGWKPR